MLVQAAKDELAVGVPLIRGQSVPFDRLFEVLGDAAAKFISLAELDLGLGIAALGRRPKIANPDEVFGRGVARRPVGGAVT